MSKIYLASAFDRQSEMKNYASDLKSIGYTISSTWLEEETVAAHNITKNLGRRYAERDSQEIQNSDIIIVFLEDVPHSRPLTGGRLVEMGIGLVSVPIIYTVGKPENVFAWHPKVQQFKTWDELFQHLDVERFEEV